MFKEGTNTFVQKENLRHKTLSLPAGKSLKALELGTVLSKKADLESLRTALKGGSTCPGAAETQGLDSGLLRFTCQGRALAITSALGVTASLGWILSGVDMMLQV